MQVGGSGSMNSDINVTPLVDVVLVLLIIFMVITPVVQMGYLVKVPPKAPSNLPPSAVQDQIILRLVGEGRAATVFDVAAFHGVQKEILGFEEFPLHLWSYPPHFLFFVSWLGVFGYWAALALWSVVTAGLYAAAAGAVLGRESADSRPSKRWFFLLALAPATLVNLLCGQTGAIAAALFFGGLWAMHARPLVAGVLFGLLTVKPQLGILLPVVLLLERRWATILTAIATTAALVGLSAWAFGSSRRRTPTITT